MKTLSINRMLFVAFATFLSIILYSCQKENSLSSNSADTLTEEQVTTYSDESAQVEASFNDVEDLSMTAAGEESSDIGTNGRVSETGWLHPGFEELRLRIGVCATITVTPDDGTYPKTITIDFGAGCICADGKFRKGAIILELTGPIRRNGSVLTITLRDFYLNRAHIEGTKTITNLSENGNINFTVVVSGGKLTFPNGRGYKYESLKYVKQIEGGATKTFRDDVYSIEGRSKTEFNGGLTIELNTETALIKKVACPWISEGTLKIKIKDRTLMLDFGAPNNGDCDNKALLTWNNGANTKLILLP